MDGLNLATDKMLHRQIQFVKIRLDQDLLRVVVLAEDLIPVSAVRLELYQTGGTDCQHLAMAIVLAQCRQQGLIHAHVGNAQVARQELHVRQRVALTSGQDTGHRRQVRYRLWKEINTM